MKDAKVTCMEFRPTAVKADRSVCMDWYERGTFVEIDVRTGSVIAAKHVAHPHPITHIFRYGRSMITLDEGGKMLIFSPGEDGEDISLQYTQPRVVRVLRNKILRNSWMENFGLPRGQNTSHTDINDVL